MDMFPCQTHNTPVSVGASLSDTVPCSVSDLLHRCVADRVRVVVVVDDLKVSDDIAFCRAAELDLWLGFPRPLRKNGEVSGFTHLHTCGGGGDSGLTI